MVNNNKIGSMIVNYKINWNQRKIIYNKKLNKVIISIKLKLNKKKVKNKNKSINNLN